MSNNNIIKTGIEITGDFKSVNGLGEGTKIVLAYRDQQTGKFETIAEGEVDFDGKFSIFGEQVTLFGEGKELAIVFNGKYRTFQLTKEDFVGKTGFKNLYIFDNDIKYKEGEHQEENFVANSEAKAQNIWFDPMVESALMEQRLNGELLKDRLIDDGNWNETIGNEDPHIQLMELNWTRKNDIQAMIDKGASRKEIFNYAFDVQGTAQALKEQGFSEKAIEYIRDNGFNGSVKLMQQYIIPKEYQEIKLHFESVDKMTTNEFYGIKGEEEKPSEGGGTNAPKPQTQTNIQVNVEKKEPEVVIAQQNPYEIYFIAAFITIIFILVGALVYLKFKKKKEGEE